MGSPSYQLVVAAPRLPCVQPALLMLLLRLAARATAASRKRATRASRAGSGQGRRVPRQRASRALYGHLSSTDSKATSVSTSHSCPTLPSLQMQVELCCILDWDTSVGRPRVSYGIDAISWVLVLCIYGAGSMYGRWLIYIYPFRTNSGVSIYAVTAVVEQGHF